MKTGILYVTFARDLEWTRFSLESVVKYGTGISQICIAVPTWDRDKFTQFERYSRPGCPVIIKDFLEYPGKGFVHHLAMKCSADVLMPDCDVIIHQDPDTLWHEPFSPHDYVRDGKCILIVEPYEYVKTVHEGRYNWKHITEFALGFECKYETMCKHPTPHLGGTYPLVRAHIEKLHGTTFADFVLKQENTFPQGFGEFNTLGSYAEKFLRDKYIVVDQTVESPPKDKVTQMWSYRGVGAYMDTIKKILE